MADQDEKSDNPAIQSVFSAFKVKKPQTQQQASEPAPTPTPMERRKQRMDSTDDKSVNERAGKPF